MICQKCGTEVPERAAFCTKCGDVLVYETVETYANRPQPKAWLTESILVTIFCCIPFGIVGIVHASMVNAKFEAGDIEGAERASQQAGKWTKLGFWLGLAGAILYIIFYAIMFSLGLFADSFQ